MMFCLNTSYLKVQGQNLYATFNSFEGAIASTCLKSDNSYFADKWNYTDQASWSKMAGSQCSGTSQSPINLPPMVEMEYSENLKQFQFSGYEVVVTDPVVVNNGHTSIRLTHLKKNTKDKNFLISL